MATLSTLGPADLRDQARDHALRALRYELATHVSGRHLRTDGSQWGRHWLSPLGVERMMHAMPHLEPHLVDDDRTALRRVLLSEADWLLHHHRKGRHEGLFAGLWNGSGLNVPESNLWSGAMLWRAAAMYGDDPNGGAMREMAHAYLINAVSVPADAEDDTRVAGRPVRERHVGANFFPNFALDHHGYLNVGYMVICVSNAAILHFDAKSQGFASPESLHHHMGDLWSVVRRMLFSDGRLARIGGDSRIPYTYCQEYLVPALLYAADHLGDPTAMGQLGRQLRLMRLESESNGDGSFYSRRLSGLAAASPYYYDRLETDRACVLSMLLNALPRVAPQAITTAQQTALAYEQSVAGGWAEPGHGAVLHRCPTRLASLTWRGFDWCQVLCTPPDDGSFADWRSNLVGVVRCMGDDGQPTGMQTRTRRLVSQAVAQFDGGFLAMGSYFEGAETTLPAELRLNDLALARLAVAGLPDGHTVVVLHRCTARLRMYTHYVMGMHLSVPNDIFNGMRRRIETASGCLTCAGPPAESGMTELPGTWACIDGRLGVAGLYGAEALTLERSPHRRSGKLGGLFLEKIGWSCEPDTRAWDPGEDLLDVGYAAISCPPNVGALAHVSATTSCDMEPAAWAAGVRGLSLTGLNGRRFRFVANFGERPSEVFGQRLAVGEARLSAPVRNRDDLLMRLQSRADQAP